MAVYGKKFSKKQKALLQRYENHCGFEPLYQEDFDRKEITFEDLWKRNVDFIQDIADEISRFNTNGCFKESK